MQEREEPQLVFTPATPVRDDMYAVRVEDGLEDRVETALKQPGRQVVVYGDTGVGKTSLIEYLCRRFAYRYHRAEFGPPMTEIFATILANLLGVEEVEQVQRETRTLKGGV